MPDEYPKHRNIFRIETGNTRGWQVRIERHKKQYNKLFSDTVHGGTGAALEAALAWRDAMYAKVPGGASTRAHLNDPRTQRKRAEALNRTGVIGIGFSMHTQKSGIRTPYVGCYWSDPETGRRCASNYSINKHGVRGALKLACQRLREGRGENPTPYQIEYCIRKALPAIRKLHAEAMAEEEKRRRSKKTKSRRT